MHRAHADYLAGRTRHFFHDATTQEFANRFASAKKLAGKIHVNYCVPLRECHVVKRRVAL